VSGRVTRESTQMGVKVGSGSSRKWREVLPERRRFADSRTGSLDDALDEALTLAHSGLRSTREHYGADAMSSATLTGDRRSAVVRKRGRGYGVTLWENAVVIASGSTHDLSDVVLAIQLALDHPELRTSELVADVPFLTLGADALRYESGAYVEDLWQDFLARRFDRYAPDEDVFHFNELPAVIRLAAERPELRRLWPYMSLNRFSVGRHNPPDNEIPLIVPLGNDRFALTSHSGGEVVLTEGDPTIVLDALVENIRRLDQ